MNSDIVARGLTTKGLLKRIFEVERPEDFTRTLPAQSLYTAIRHEGLEAAVEIIEMASIEQCRTFLDLDCWDKDSFVEETFLEWFSLSDENTGLGLIQKLLKAVDLRLIALMIARHISIEIFEDPSENPPGPGYYTPDKGSTWIYIDPSDPDRHFTIARLLALIFETNAELFYQLIAIPGIETPSLLEEESFRDKSKRLASHGIPEMDYAGELNVPIPISAALADLKKAGRHPVIEDLPVIEPLIYDTIIRQPLGAIFRDSKNRADLEGELTLVLNGAIVRWNVPFHEFGTVRDIAEKVVGAINLGFESLCNESGESAQTVFDILGLQKVYRVGLWYLLELRRKAGAISSDIGTSDQALGVLVECLKKLPPGAPMFFDDNGKYLEEDGRLIPGEKAIDSANLYKAIEKKIDEVLAGMVN